MILTERVIIVKIKSFVYPEVQVLLEEELVLKKHFYLTQF